MTAGAIKIDTGRVRNQNISLVQVTFSNVEVTVKRLFGSFYISSDIPSHQASSLNMGKELGKNAPVTYFQIDWPEGHGFAQQNGSNFFYPPFMLQSLNMEPKRL